MGTRASVRSLAKARLPTKSRAAGRGTPTNRLARRKRSVKMSAPIQRAIAGRRRDGMAATYSDLAGKTVLVTGGGSGIGEAIVRRFAQQKSKVAFIDIA